MRNLVLIFGLAMLAFVVACANPAAPPVRVENAASPSNAASAEQQHDDAPRISLADAKKDFDDGTAIIMDVRSEEAYKQEHIKSSINLANGINDEQLNKIPKGKKIIAYCS
ncbi:MAG TPA: rhodanese-like domain-containing protein [Pyrinomonadaceae bacterium]|nr:rhodanese-like domain-containing protein [Pyrinomonadaceae bacterium]